MSYIGSTPTTQSFIAGTDYFNGNGSTTAFTLSRPVVSVNDIQAVVNNVVQVPNDAYNVSGSTITFTSAPSSGTGNVYVRYLSTTTQSITPSQNTVSYATWDNDLRNETFAFKNRLINGDMNIDQRNNGAAVTFTSLAELYTVDRWQGRNQTDGAFSMQQVADAPAGFTNSLRLTVTTADASLAAGQYCQIRQAIEGFNAADLAWGTSAAQAITLSFWVKSSITGAFNIALTNASNLRGYTSQYNISSANTWEQKSVTIPGDTSGTWVTNNGVGVRVAFTLGAGSSFIGTPNTWIGEVMGSSGIGNVMATNGATWQVTGVQLEKGTTATNFDVLPFGTELALCQRYYEVGGNNAASQAEGSGTEIWVSVQYKVNKRATPTIGTTNSGLLYLRQYGVAGRAGSGCSVVNAYLGTTSAQVRFNGFTGLPTGASMFTSGFNEANPTVDPLFISAEL
jgi:hypothetical protein